MPRQGGVTSHLSHPPRSAPVFNLKKYLAALAIVLYMRGSCAVDEDFGTAAAAAVERIVRDGQWERRCNCRPSARGQRHIGDLQSSLPARQRRQQRPQPNDDDDDDDAILHSVCVAPPPPAVHHATICLTSDLRRTDVTAHLPPSPPRTSASSHAVYNRKKVAHTRLPSVGFRS